MYRSPWFTLILGLMAGLVIGYVLAEQQPVPPGKALRLGMGTSAGQTEALPEGHPPVNGMESDVATRAASDGQVAGLGWTVPDGWRLGPQKSMRAATYIVTVGGAAAPVPIRPLSGANTSACNSSNVLPLAITTSLYKYRSVTLRLLFSTKCLR